MQRCPTLGSRRWEKSCFAAFFCYMSFMQTTLEIDDDVLSTAEALAARSQRTAGAVISELVRKGLKTLGQGGVSSVMVNGFEVIPAADRVVTHEEVRSLLEDTESR